LSGVCSGITRSGTRCTLSVTGASGFCHLHDPARSDERRRAASRAGKSRPNHELRDIKSLLSDLTDRVLKVEGTEALETGPAAVANQLINTRLRAIEVERKIRETEDLERRIEALEASSGRGGKRWLA
jgi:hypothetical protein